MNNDEPMSYCKSNTYLNCNIDNQDQNLCHYTCYRNMEQYSEHDIQWKENAKPIYRLVNLNQNRQYVTEMIS